MALSRADVQRAFQNSLGRAASQVDEDAYFFASQDGDASDIQIYAAISNSQEADLTADPVVRFYQAAFGRVPDQAGLDNASDYVRQFGATPETYQKLADMFVTSPEFQARYGAGTAVDADYVQSLYANILGREASTAEVASYVSGSNGYDTRGEVLYAIAQSNEAISYASNAVNAFLFNAAEGDAVYTGSLLPDTVGPRVLISLADASLEAGQTTQVTFDFTEQVTGFDLTDVMTTRGSLSALVQSQTDPTVYTATLTARSSGTGQIALTGAYTDAAGNVGREGEADFSVSSGGGGGGNPPPANRAPVAVNDSYTTDEDTPLTVPASTGVLANDTDADRDALTVGSFTQPRNGTLTLNPDGSFTYSPNPNYFGTDTFTYTATDGSASSVPATVTLTVDPSVEANPDTNSYVVGSNVPVTGNVLANDTSGSSSGIGSLKVADPNIYEKIYGTITINRDGTYTYMPKGTDNPAFDQPGPYVDQVTYTAINEQGNTASSTLTITNIVPPAAQANDYLLDA